MWFSSSGIFQIYMPKGNTGFYTWKWSDISWISLNVQIHTKFYNRLGLAENIPGNSQTLKVHLSLEN